MEEKMRALREAAEILDIAVPKTCRQWIVLNLAWMAAEMLLYGETRPDMADTLIGFAILYIMLKANYARARWQMAERKQQDAARNEAYGMSRE